MSTLELLLQGIQACLNPMLLLLCAAGTFMGAIVGVLPGLGPATAIAILLPMIYGKAPLPSIVMLAGIYYGAASGGSITSIALNVPGESQSVVTCFDGYPLQRMGKGGKAMGMAILSSFFGGSVGVILLTLLATPLARFALKFGPQEYFAVYVFTFVAIICIGKMDVRKGFISLFLGLLISTVGQDTGTGVPRLDFGIVHLWGKIDFIPVAVGLMGLSEIVLSITEDLINTKKTNSYKFTDIFPNVKELVLCMPSIIRGSIVGFFVGVLPGAGATIATMLTYKIEEQVASDRENFGKGSLQGVAGPESSNNSCTMGACVPMLSLGIPGSGTTAVLLGALVMVGLQPGPRLFLRNTDFVWGLIGSMYIGNVMLVILCILLIPLFLWLLKVSQNTLPVIVGILCIIGTFSVQNSFFDVGLMLFFAVIGLFFKTLDFPLPPFLIGVILGFDLELKFLQTMQIFKGDLRLISTRPIALTLFVLCVAMFAIPITRWALARKKRNQTAVAK